MTKKCPFCAETIQEDAKKCRYCGEWLTKKENLPINKAVPNKANFPLRKYYFIWLSSIFAFFSTFFFSENGFISDLVCIIIVGLFAIIGIVYFIKLLRAIIKSPTTKSRTKYILLIIASVALFFVLAKINPPIYRYSPNEAGIRKTMKEEAKINAKTEQGLRKIYKKFLSSSFKNSYTEDEFVKNNLTHNQSEGILATKSDTHSIYIDGVEGYVDTTFYYCADTSCTNIMSQSRLFKKYVYENQRWLVADEPTACPRKQMYEMDPEFSRAISLIAQRLASDNDFQQVKNCLKVSYATSEAQMGGAEGYFNFVPGQSLIELDIFVSPKYKEDDDLLTAFLLAHEGQHAANYGIGLLQGKPIGCFEDEAWAFDAQYVFIASLNPGEKDSLVSRFYQNSSFPELWNVYATYAAILKQPGYGFLTKATNYVKSVPAYQKECAGR